MKSREFSKTKFLAVFSLTTLVFIIGIVVGNYLTEMKLSQVNEMEKDLTSQTRAVELQSLILTSDPCSAVNTSTLTEELYDIAVRVEHMENSLGEDDPDVTRLKNYYSLLELQHWLVVKAMEKDCNRGNHWVLYFYDDDENCPNCQLQGDILTYLRKKHQNVFVYSFDINASNVAVQTVKDMYDVNGTPFIVYNGKGYNHFISREEVEGIYVNNLNHSVSS